MATWLNSLYAETFMSSISFLLSRLLYPQLYRLKWPNVH